MKIKIKNDKMKLKIKKKSAKRATKKILKDKNILRVFRAAFMRPDMKLKECRKILKKVILLMQLNRHVSIEEDPSAFFENTAREKYKARGKGKDSILDA